MQGLVVHIVDAEKTSETNHPRGFGVEFTDVSAEQITHIAQLVRTAMAQRMVANPPPSKK